jgi:cell division protein FtsQ
MPRVVRQPRNSVNDRPGRLKILWRRQRRVLRRGIWLLALLPVLLVAAMAMQLGRNSSLVSMRERLGVLAADAGLRVTDIRIEGRANTPDPLLRAAIGVAKGDPTLGFSLSGVRARVESLAWVQQATVERRLPGTLVIELVERRPFAIWQHNGKFVLVDRAGQTVADEDVGHFKDLPLVVGAGAPVAAAALLDALRDRPTLQSHVIAAVRVGERRWNLRLANGGDVLLPEGQELAALNRLQQLQQEHALLDRPLQTIDLRLPDRLVVRPQPAPQAEPAAPAKTDHPEPQRRT